jgi:hypothetical protein
MSGFRIDVQLGDLGMDELADGAEAAVRPGAQAGAQVFYDRVKQNVGRLGRRTGKLSSSIYQVFSKDNSGRAVAQYHISWNRKKAPHGHLVEFGHVQRYVTYVDKRGEWKTLVRPEMRGKLRPKRHAALAVKDAYFVPLKGGPRIVGAKSFVRAAMSPDVVRSARNAMVDRFWYAMEEKGLL